MWTVFVRCVWELRPWMTSELTRDFSYLYFPQSLPFVLLSLDINPLPEYIFAMYVCTCSSWIFVYGSISLFLEVEFTIWCCSSAVTFGWCLLIKLFLVRISCFCQDKADRDVSQCLIKKKNRFCCYKHSKKSSNKRIQGRNSDKCSDPLALKTFS